MEMPNTVNLFNHQRMLGMTQGHFDTRKKYHRTCMTSNSAYVLVVFLSQLQHHHTSLRPLDCTAVDGRLSKEQSDWFAKCLSIMTLITPLLRLAMVGDSRHHRSNCNAAAQLQTPALSAICGTRQAQVQHISTPPPPVSTLTWPLTLIDKR
jgi:hypothetical protein